MQNTTSRDVTPSILEDCYVLSEKSIAPDFQVSKPGQQTASKTSGETTPDILLSTLSTQVSEPIQPHINWVPGEFSPRVKRPRREADHSPPTSAEVKNIYIKHMREWVSLEAR
jgi:hypothetical protein